MQPTWQTPRPALLWMLISVLTALALHVGHLPLWLLGAAALTILWQIQVYRGAWQHPARYIKVLLTLTCFGGVLISYGRFLGLEPMVALLVSGFLLKLLEIHHRRDALVLIYLAYFIVIIQCLFFNKYLAGAIPRKELSDPYAVISFRKNDACSIPEEFSPGILRHDNIPAYLFILLFKSMVSIPLG